VFASFLFCVRNAIITLGGINIANVHRGLVNIDPYKVQIAAGGAYSRHVQHEFFKLINQVQSRSHS